MSPFEAGRSFPTPTNFPDCWNPSADTALASWPELSLSAAQRAPHGAKHSLSIWTLSRQNAGYHRAIFIFAPAVFTGHCALIDLSQRSTPNHLTSSDCVLLFEIKHRKKV